MCHSWYPQNVSTKCIIYSLFHPFPHCSGRIFPPLYLTYTNLLTILIDHPPDLVDPPSRFRKLRLISLHASIIVPLKQPELAEGARPVDATSIP